MTRTPPVTALEQPRLVGLLAEIAGASAAMPAEQFGQRLGRLVDLSSSVALAETLGGLGREPFEVTESEPGRARNDFLRVHEAMVAAVLRSLAPEKGATRIKWPLPEDGEEPPAEAYSRFYAANQREMEARVRGLQERVRDVLSGTHESLSQLATLDAALGDALLAHSRRLLGGIPPLVARRLLQHRSEDAGSAADHLKKEVQALLLAEVEVRLLPTQGLIEALDQFSDSEE